MKEKELISQFWSADDKKKASLFVGEKKWGADFIKTWTVAININGEDTLEKYFKSHSEAENYAETEVLS